MRIIFFVSLTEILFLFILTALVLSGVVEVSEQYATLVLSEILDNLSTLAGNTSSSIYSSAQNADGLTANDSELTVEEEPVVEEYNSTVADETGALVWLPQTWSDIFKNQNSTSFRKMVATTEHADNDFKMSTAEGIFTEDFTTNTEDGKETTKYSKTEIVWNKFLKKEGNQAGTFLISDRNGDLVVVGFTSDSVQSKKRDMLFVKLDSEGQLLFEKSFGTIGDDYIGSIVEAEDGYIVVGSAFHSSERGNDVYIAKLSYNGLIVWERFYGTTGEDRAEFITKSYDGNYLVCGYAGNNETRGRDFFIMKINEEGEVLWDKITNLGGDEAAYSVVESLDGSYVVCGGVYYNNNLDGFVVKFGSDLEVEWHTILSGPGEDVLFSVAETSYGDYIFVGEKSHSAQVDYPYIVKFSTTGEKIWEKILDFDGGGTLVSIVRLNKNSYVAAGKLRKGDFGKHDAYYIKINDSGDIIYNYVVGGEGDDHFNCVGTTPYREIVFLGWTNSFGALGRDLYVVKAVEN